MFQADSDFYQQYEAADGTWQTTEQVIQGEELLFRREGEEEPNDGTHDEEAHNVPQTEEEEEEAESPAETEGEDVHICESETQWCYTEWESEKHEEILDITWNVTMLLFQVKYYSLGLYLQIGRIAQAHDIMIWL